MHDERVWPCVVVGGGPAAALQVSEIRRRGGEVLVLAERTGGTFAFLGEQRTQSYADELDVGAPGVALTDYLSGQGQPTGSAYARYLRHALKTCGFDVRPASVDDVRPEEESLVVTGTDRRGRPARWRARRVILATGSKPRTLDRDLEPVEVRSCLDVYRDVNEGGLGAYRGRSVVIVGCGNTAMQLAAMLAWSARDVTVLGNRYVGLYPHETMDRFGWRAASQLTCELIVRSRQRATADPPKFQPSVRYLVYDQLEVADGQLMFSYSRAANDNVLGHHSLPDPADGHRPTIRSDGPGRWREALGVRSTVVVVATGFSPAYPQGRTIGALPRNADGTVQHRDGRVAEIPGLFVGGACAGYPAVNFMTVAASTEEQGHSRPAAR